MQQTTWTPVYFIAQLFYFIALVRTASAPFTFTEHRPTYYINFVHPRGQQ